MIEYRREFLCEVVSDVDGLLQEHYLELAKNQDKVKLNPDWQRYAFLEQAGSFLIFTAREDCVLIGYAAFFSSPHPHYADLRLVSNDVLFVEQKHRTGRTGIRLIQFAETQIAHLYGSNYCITWHAKENTPLAGMLGRMGYGLQDIVLSKLF